MNSVILMTILMITAVFQSLVYWRGEMNGDAGRTAECSQRVSILGLLEGGNEYVQSGIGACLAWSVSILGLLEGGNEYGFMVILM